MGRPSLSGPYAQTVLGPVPCSDLGRVLPHEHLLIDLRAVAFQEPLDERGRALARKPITIEHLGWVRRHWTSSLDNLHQLDEALAIDELRGFAEAGGDAGVGDHLLLAHDICQKHRLSAFGGHGFGHLTGEILPWMQQRGFSEAETSMLFVDNPARALAVTAGR